MKTTLGLAASSDSGETKITSHLAAVEVFYILYHEITLKDMTKLLKAATTDNTENAGTSISAKISIYLSVATTSISEPQKSCFQKVDVDTKDMLMCSTRLECGDPMCNVHPV